MKRKTLLALALLVLALLLVIIPFRHQLIDQLGLREDSFELRGLFSRPWPPEQGWYEAKGGRVYYEKRRRLTGWQIFERKVYYLDELGYQKKGWQQIDGEVYYLDPEKGHRHTGFTLVDDKTYYLDDETGRLLRDLWLSRQEGHYYLDEGGSPLIGWQKIDDEIYYLDLETARRQTGFIQLGSKTYYLDDESGALLRDQWLTRDQDNYYLSSDGSLALGWLELDDTSYYLDPSSGKRQTGFIKKDDKTYFLDEDSGALLRSQWLERGDRAYYLTDEGSFAKGWLELEEDSYYLDPESGVRQVGFIDRDDKSYYLDEESGRLLKESWLELEEGTYYLQEDGSLARGRVKTPDGNFLFNKKTGLLRADLSQPVIHLSYDDGPSHLSNELLDYLKKEGVQVSFFYQGMMIPGREEILKRAYDEGHSIGSHAYDHPSFPELSKDEIRWQMDKTDELIKGATGEGAKWFRSPYGASSDKVLATVGKPTIHWDIDSEDWKGYSPEEIRDYVMDVARDGGIILMHETKENALEATKLIVPELKKKGYRLVNLETLFEMKGVVPKKDGLYTGL